MSARGTGSTGSSFDSEEAEAFAGDVGAAKEFTKGDVMSDIVYRAEIPITRVKGPLRLARLPVEPEPVRFGTHGAIARHYGIQGEVTDPHATTLDYIIAATGG